MAADPGGTSAQVAASDENQSTWPPPEEQLEKWMMNTVKEGDQSARFLRTLLQMDPAYGTYLQTDPDLFGVIQMFSKRLRTKVARYDSPSNMPQDIFYQTLCEMLWRVVGWVMHEVVELEEEANMPVPKEASGMIRMLLNTNTKLTNKLNDVRRAHLKELAVHRDKQRHISAQTQRAIDQLHESPIMFFDPLEFVLDESTKAFVRDAIEERMKLEMRTNFQNNEENAEMNNYIEELEGRLELSKAELETCRATNNRLEEQAKTQKEREEKTQGDLRAKKEELAECQRLLADAEEAVKQMQQDTNKHKRRIEHLEQKVSGNPENGKGGGGKDGQVQYIDLNKDELEALRAKVKEYEKDLKYKDSLIEKIQNEIHEVKSMHGGEVREVEKIVYQEDEETKQLLMQAMQVEKELRAANEALEKALKDTESEMKEMEKELKSLGKQVKERQPKDKHVNSKLSAADEGMAEKHAELEKKMKKTNAQHEKIVGEMQDEIDKLKAKLQDVVAELKKYKEGELEGKPSKSKVVKQVGIPEEEFTKLKVKCHEQEVEIERMEMEYAKLEQKCNMLLEKLKDKFSDSEIANIVEKIKLAPPPKPKKERKKKAYERLYDDAQRRIGEMKMRQTKVQEMQEKQLAKLKTKVKSPADVRKMDMLQHLHRANTATAQRFHDALSDFDKQTRRQNRALVEGEEGEESGGESSGDEDEVMRRQRAGLSDLDEITLQTYKIGVCPRCAFSAMAAFQRRHREIYLAQQRKEKRDQQAIKKDKFEEGTPWGSLLFLTDGMVPGRSVSATLGRSYSDILSQPTLSHGFTDSLVYGSEGSGTWQDFGSEKRSLSPGSISARLPIDGTLSASQRAGSPPNQGQPRRSPRNSPRGAGTPLGGGPIAGPLPYDSAFPLPTPPWRQELGASQIPSAPSTAPAMKSASQIPTSPSTGSLRGGVQMKSKDAQVGDMLLRDAPPWRRERSSSAPREGRLRSQSPEEHINIIARSSGELLAQPPGGAPPRGGAGAIDSFYGRLGRHPGSEWTAPLAPGRLPAAQTMPLDPIQKFSGLASEQPQRSSDRSMSPEWTAKRSSEGFRSIRTATNELEIDYSRPATVPAARKVHQFRRASFESDQPAAFRSETGGELHTFGGGARATIWKDAGSTQLPSVPLSRSAPNIAMPSREVRVPWHGPEVPWESAPKKFGSKAPKKSGLGFVVTPLQSQERLSATMPAKLGEG